MRDELAQVVRVELDVLLGAAIRLQVAESADSKRCAAMPVDHLAVHLDQAAVRVEGEAGLSVAFARPSTASSFRPRLRIVSIIPGIETAAPERTETSNGSAESPKRLPVFCSRRVEVLVHLRAEPVRQLLTVRACRPGRRPS